jgi:hypothetical protein
LNPVTAALRVFPLVVALITSPAAVSYDQVRPWPM